MNAPSTEAATEAEPGVETTFDSLEPGKGSEPKRQVWQRLEEIEDERRVRDELADWDDFELEN